MTWFLKLSLLHLTVIKKSLSGFLSLFFITSWTKAALITAESCTRHLMATREWLAVHRLNVTAVPELKWLWLDVFLWQWWMSLGVWIVSCSEWEWTRPSWFLKHICDYVTRLYQQPDWGVNDWKRWRESQRFQFA